MTRYTVLASVAYLATSVYAQSTNSVATAISAVRSASSSSRKSTSVTQAASPSVVSIYFPGADQQPYVASLIGESNGAKTLAISCAPGVDADTCGFPSSVTVTAGPSTAFVSVSNQEATFIYDCKITASTTAVCTETFNGNVGYIMTQKSSGAAASTSSVITETLASTDITWIPITITAGGKSTPTKTGSIISADTKKPITNTNGAWNNEDNMGVVTSKPNTAVVPSNTKPAGDQNSPVAGTSTTPAATTKTGTGPATWTGAAVRNGAYGGYVAGMLAVIGMAL